MTGGLLVAIALLGAPANAVPPSSQQAPAAEAKAADRCPKLPNAQPGEILVCAERPKGYRIDPDVLEASRGMRKGGRPKRPERLKDNSCAVVGEAGCIGAAAGINLIGAALTAAQMAARLSRGEEIGSMFVTDPQMSEYELYVAAKRRREAEEAAAKAKSKAAAPPKP